MSSTRNAKIRTLERAVAAYGGARHLPAYLNLERSQVEDWLAGRVEIPPEIFALALDLVAAGPFVRWCGDDDSAKAERHQAHATQLQDIADRIKASAARAQHIADEARRTADRAAALARVQHVLAEAESEQQPEQQGELEP
jgi:hypothetical protein